MRSLTLTVSIDHDLMEALELLRKKMERYAIYKLPAGEDKQVKLSRSKVVRMCLESACKKHGIKIQAHR